MTGAHREQRATRAPRPSCAAPGAAARAPRSATSARCCRAICRAVDRPGVMRVELTKLQLDALTERARSDAGRIERLHAREHRLDLCRVALDLGAQSVGDLLEALGEIAVVADGIDDGARDRRAPEARASPSRAATAGAPAAIRPAESANSCCRSSSSAFQCYRLCRRCARPSPRRGPRRSCPVARRPVAATSGSGGRRLHGLEAPVASVSSPARA